MATTTEIFQVNPDYYTSADECAAMERKKANTNPRYKFFKQTHFTAGDTDQFDKYRDATNGRICIADIPLDKNRFRGLDTTPLIQWVKYRELNAAAVMNTFNYLFNKFKKGIFIKVKNGKLRVFLPFSKKNFTNEWHDRIHVDPRYGNLIGFIKYINGLEKRPFSAKRVNGKIDSWYANNCLVRYEYPISEGDSNNPNMSDMFKTLCNERDIPDMEVFVNRRDFPLLKRNGTEPYAHMWDTANQKLVSHNYRKYAPILSMVTTDDNADIPIPTGDDWARVSRGYGKYFSKTCSRVFKVDPTPWNERKPIAVFRGGSTGCGVTIKTNQRLNLAYISYSTPNDTDDLPLLDAGITNWNLRPRKLKKVKYLQTIDTKALPFGLVGRLSPQEQSHYKYIVNVEGHVSAFRLGVELASGACVILAASKYKMWYSSMLKPFEHYVPVKADLGDLIDKIKWCKTHDAKCSQIAKNAQAFAAKYLGKEGILDYLQKLLVDLKKETGVYLYNNESLLDLQEKKEQRLLKQLTVPRTSYRIEDVVEIQPQGRTHSLMLGIEWLTRMAINANKFMELAPQDKVLFKNRLSVISEHQFAGFSCAVKSTTDKERKREMIHETFVSTHGTNELLKQIPNFAYIFGMFEDAEGSHMVMERVSGKTLADYIKSPEFNWNDYLLIVLQITLALHVAQRTCGLVHYDLTPWNIIIQRLPAPMTFEYIIDHKIVQTVTTQIVPVIIDMGRAHIIYEDDHYGTIHKFQTSTVQDVVTFLTTSLFEISGLNLDWKTTTEVIKLANFMTGTTYRKSPFRETGRNGLRDLRFFLDANKKYTELISRNKGDLEEKTPRDLYNYIRGHFHENFPIVKNDRLSVNMARGNARQVFDYAFAKTPKERAKSFAKVFKRVLKCRLPVIENVFFVYYIIQSMTENLKSVVDIMTRYMTSVDLDSTKYVAKYNEAMVHLSNIYEKPMNSTNETVIEYSPVGSHSSTRCPYTMLTFEMPEKILALLKKIVDDRPDDLTPYKEIIERILLNDGPYKLKPEVREYYLKNFASLLAVNSLYMKVQVANRKSLWTTASEMYPLDKKAAAKRIEKEGGGCDTAKRYLATYEEILRIVH